MDGQFFCADGETVDVINVCDGNDDCHDGTDLSFSWDEAPDVCHPANGVCCSGLIPCETGGHCVSTSSLCSGSNQCEDGSDETNCPALGGESKLLHV